MTTNLKKNIIKKVFYSFLIVNFLLLISCTNIKSTKDIDVKESNNEYETRFFYKGKPFSGIAIDTIDLLNDTIIGNHRIKNGYLHGTSTVYYSNGQLKSKINFYKNLYNGDYEEYYSNGQLKKVEIYKNDTIVDGIYKSFYQNGQLSVEASYKGGLLDGVHKYYDKDGTLLKNYNYRNGKRHGYFYDYSKSSSSKKISKGKYNNGEYENYLDQEFHNEKLVSESTFDGKITVRKAFHKNGKLLFKTIYDTEQDIYLSRENLDSMGNYNWRKYLIGEIEVNDKYSDGGIKRYTEYTKNDKRVGEEYYYNDGVSLKSRYTYSKDKDYYEEFLNSGELKRTGILNNNWIYFDKNLNYNIPKFK